MNVSYNGEHSVRFGDRHSWDDWRLVPASKPIFPPPEQKLTLIEIPGADGVVDLSTALTGHPVYKNRETTFRFYVTGDANATYALVLNYLHGKILDIVLTDEPDRTYTGRCAVSDFAVPSDGSPPTISIDCSVAPYKTSGSYKEL